MLEGQLHFSRRTPAAPWTSPKARTRRSDGATSSPWPKRWETWCPWCPWWLWWLWCFWWLMLMVSMFRMGSRPANSQIYLGCDGFNGWFQRWVQAISHVEFRRVAIEVRFFSWWWNSDPQLKHQINKTDEEAKKRVWGCFHGQHQHPQHPKSQTVVSDSNQGTTKFR